MLLIRLKWFRVTMCVPRMQRECFYPIRFVRVPTNNILKSQCYTDSCDDVCIQLGCVLALLIYIHVVFLSFEKSVVCMTSKELMADNGKCL